MKRHGAIALGTMGFACPLAFWFYGAGRTMYETVGLNIRAMAAGSFIGVICPTLMTISALFVLRRFWTNLKPMTLLSIILGLGIGLSIGSILSEGWILVDESKFASEVHESTSEQGYGRARSWPNEGCSLVYVPGRGIHATD